MEKEGENFGEKADDMHKRYNEQVLNPEFSEDSKKKKWL